MNPHRCALSDPSTLVQIPGASGYGLKVQRASSRMPYPCALSIPYSTSLILCVHWILTWNLEVLCTDARCGGRTGHILHGVNHHLGPVHQPPSSLALDRDPCGPARWGVWRARLRSYAPTGTQTWRETREPGCGLCSLCGPGGVRPGYGSRSSAVRILVFVSSLGSHL